MPIHSFKNATVSQQALTAILLQHVLLDPSKAGCKLCRPKQLVGRRRRRRRRQVTPAAVPLRAACAGAAVVKRQVERAAGGDA